MNDFPRQYARTRRFRLGAPRDFTISPDGATVLFLRSRGGDDPTMCLWRFDSDERLLVDSGRLLDGAEEITPEERIRRERTRDQTVGMTAYANDRDLRLIAFAVSGRLWCGDLEGNVRELPARAPVVDPRPSPDGSAIAYVSSGALRIINTDGTGDRELVGPDGPEVSYGLPEHVAQESMWRYRGYWWEPDGGRLLVARVDLAPVQRWYIADPAHPGNPPVEVAYPVVGTANADVSLWLVDRDGGRVEVDWDRVAYEYLVDVHWSSELLIVVQDRKQHTMRVLAVDPDTGATDLRREDTDPCWVEINRGVPALTGAGGLVWMADVDESRRLLVDGKTVTPDGLNVREVLDVDGDTVLFAASAEPTEIHLWTYTTDGGLTQVTEQAGVHSGRRTGGTTVMVSQSLGHDGPRATIHRNGSTAEIRSLVETPVIEPKVELFRAGDLELRAAILFPTGHVPGSAKLPVLLDPYGGPAAQRVLAARGQYLASQWFADQGFAVLVVDGRGTPGRGPAWDKTIYGDRASLPLDDQVAALHAAAERYPDLDLTRVGIRGWSYGGYLAAQAVLRRGDVFHAAVSGAPVTDHALYDGAYNERYLGMIDEVPTHYERSNIIKDAPNLRRPLMLIHGLADDNVVAAHTLRLSSALLAAGRPHTVIPLTGDTHMVHNLDVAENLLRIEVEFLKTALG